VATALLVLSNMSLLFVLSRCPCRLIVPKRKAAQIISSGLCLVARCKECPFVSLQKPNPRLDIASVTLVEAGAAPWVRP
jgi:hypothetical protein